MQKMSEMCLLSYYITHIGSNCNRKVLFILTNHEQGLCLFLFNFANHILKHGSSLLIVLEHTPACAGRRKKNAVPAFGVFERHINSLLHGLYEPISLESGLLTSGGDLFSCLPHEEKKLALADKMRNPVAVVGMLVVAAGNQDCA